MSNITYCSSFSYFSNQKEFSLNKYVLISKVSIQPRDCLDISLVECGESS